MPQAVIALMVGTCSASHWGQRSTRTKKEPVGSLVIFGVEVGYQVDQLPAVSSENMDRAQLPHEACHCRRHRVRDSSKEARPARNTSCGGIHPRCSICERRHRDQARSHEPGRRGDLTRKRPVVSHSGGFFTHGMGEGLVCCLGPGNGWKRSFPAVNEADRRCRIEEAANWTIRKFVRTGPPLPDDRDPRRRIHPDRRRPPARRCQRPQQHPPALKCALIGPSSGHDDDQAKDAQGKVASNPCLPCCHCRHYCIDRACME